RCGGNGAEPDTPVTTCPTCGGSGRVRQVSRSVFGEFVRAGTCPTCSGAGKLIEHPCEKCDGAGRVVEERTLEVEIPAGIHDGQRIRLTGEGHAGAVGARAGDVYVEVHVRPDARFVREGNDVYTTVDLTITQAALGATVSVPTLTGDEELTFEPGTQPGSILALRGRGLPVLQGFGRGNQRVLVNVTVPRRLTEEQRQLLEDFERLGGAEATAVVIEPGRAFGTGAPPPTQLCVELLLELEGGSVVDVGCGSGVLSIVAAKLGFAPVRALDSDEHAVEATRANARANGVD